MPKFAPQHGLSTIAVQAEEAENPHHNISSQDRAKMGIGEGLVRLSVGIENIEDILSDLSQGLARV